MNLNQEMFKKRVLQIQPLNDGASTKEIDEVLALRRGKIGVLNGQKVLFSFVEVDAQEASALQHQISPVKTGKIMHPGLTNLEYNTERGGA